MTLTATANNEVIISADSHVSEDPELWVQELPATFRAAAPRFRERRVTTDGGRFGEKPGGWDPAERLKEMATDGVSAEVLYPTLGLRLFGLDETKLREYKGRGDQEIWRIHPHERTLTAWRRQPDGSCSETVYRTGTVQPLRCPT
jgi:hypothetical protein